MAAQSGWRIVKTAGGYGVLKSTSGSRVTKSTVVKPSTSVSGKRVKHATKIGR